MSMFLLYDVEDDTLDNAEIFDSLNAAQERLSNIDMFSLDNLPGLTGPRNICRTDHSLYYEYMDEDPDGIATVYDYHIFELDDLADGNVITDAYLRGYIQASKDIMKFMKDFFEARGIGIPEEALGLFNDFNNMSLEDYKQIAEEKQK